MAGGLFAAPAAALSGAIAPPGDKSISHRALILGALADGETEVRGLLEGDDVMRTRAALCAMGANIDKQDEVWRVNGTGGALHRPNRVLDLGNAGTGVRLLMGLVAGRPISAQFDGDESLRSRPMGRIVEPLLEMGAEAQSAEPGRLPIEITGAAQPRPIDYRSPKASAQIKSAVLLAGLNADGVTRVTEPVRSRDHTERMLAAFGVEVESEAAANGGWTVSLRGGQSLSGCAIEVPGDPSSAAFPVVAALTTPGSDIQVRRVLMNPLRTGLFETLREMGASIETKNETSLGGETVADLRVRHSQLRGVEVPPDRAASMIDEYPVLAIAAAYAEGATVMRGVGELRVKESDRLAATANGLSACGVRHVEEDDQLTVFGDGGRPPGGGRVETHMDHRIAMSFLVMGCGAAAPVEIDSSEMIGTSFPGFVDLMNALGAELRSS